MLNSNSKQVENKWKNENKRYLFELQKFLDLVDNVKEEELKKEIYYQFIKCNKIITELAEEKFKDNKKI